MKSDSQNQAYDEQQGRGTRKRARTRIELLTAARKVFAQRGYYDASIAEITELADVGVGTFYLHFRDKDEIFTTMLADGMRALRDRVLAEVKQVAPEYAFSVSIRAILRHAYAERDLFQIALSGERRLAPTLKAQSSLIEGFTQAFETAQAMGLLEGFDIPILARFITGMLTQAIVWWFENDEPPPDVMADQVLRLLREGLPAQLLIEDHVQ
jgi:AcrR family transcriptional regulator